MRNRVSAIAISLLFGAVMAIPAVAQNELNRGSNQDAPADGRGNRVRQLPPRAAASTGSVTTGNGISYHNGPVMKGTVNVYFIWYGNWAQDTNASPILTDWVTTIGGSPYMGINTTYGDTVGNVSGAIAYGGSTADTGSFGTSLTDSNIASIVSNALSSGALPIDANGVYFVLTAPGVNETSGFLTQYCGWHTYGSFNGINIKYSFVGDAAGPNLRNCAAQTSSSPNGDPAVDAMASVMAHELEEAASDPNLNAWYDSSGYENADKCAWTFGSEYQATNGSLANMKLGARDFLIQQNWVNASGGYCALSYTATPDFSLSVSPTSQSVMAGNSTSAYTMSATALNGWSGTVTYSVTAGLPTGAISTIVNNSITIATSSTTPAGNYNFTISGTDANNLTHATTATLVVTVPSFTISLSPGSTSVSRPGSVQYTVAVAPQPGFTDNVGLTVSGARTGLTFGPLNPQLVTGGNGTSTFTATVTTNARKGTVTITVTGKGVSTGITKSASATLRIQ